MQRGVTPSRWTLPNPSLAYVREAGQLLSLLLDQRVGDLVVLVGARLEGSDDSAADLRGSTGVQRLGQAATADVAGQLTQVSSAMVGYSRR